MKIDREEQMYEEHEIQTTSEVLKYGIISKIRLLLPEI